MANPVYPQLLLDQAGHDLRYRTQLRQSALQDKKPTQLPGQWKSYVNHEASNAYPSNMPSPYAPQRTYGAQQGYNYNTPQGYSPYIQPATNYPLPYSQSFYSQSSYQNYQPPSSLSPRVYIRGGPQSNRYGSNSGHLSTRSAGTYQSAAQDSRLNGAYALNNAETSFKREDVINRVRKIQQRVMPILEGSLAAKENGFKDITATPLHESSVKAARDQKTPKTQRDSGAKQNYQREEANWCFRLEQRLLKLESAALLLEKDMNLLLEKRMQELMFKWDQVFDDLSRVVASD